MPSFVTIVARVCRPGWKQARLFHQQNLTAHLPEKLFLPGC
jgi:hypothetical protein